MDPAKARLRDRLRRDRAAYVAAMDDRRACERDAAHRLIDRLPRIASLAAYVALGDEFGAGPLLAAAAARGMATALPHVTTRDAPMRFLAWSPGDPLVRGPLGLSQPAFDAPELSPDAIIAPLLGFDRTGGRIGQGAGYYDRAFVAHPFALRIGLAWAAQERPHIPLDPWDVPLHAVATDRAWIAISGPTD